MEYPVEHEGVVYYSKDSFEGEPEEAFDRAKEIATSIGKPVQVTNRPLGIDHTIKPQ